MDSLGFNQLNAMTDPEVKRSSDISLGQCGAGVGGSEESVSFFGDISSEYMDVLARMCRHELRGGAVEGWAPLSHSWTLEPLSQFGTSLSLRNSGSEGNISTLRKSGQVEAAEGREDITDNKQGELAATEDEPCSTNAGSPPTSRESDVRDNRARQQSPNLSRPKVAVGDLNECLSRRQDGECVIEGRSVMDLTGRGDKQPTNYQGPIKRGQTGSGGSRKNKKCKRRDPTNLREGRSHTKLVNAMVVEIKWSFEGGSLRSLVYHRGATNDAGPNWVNRSGLALQEGLDSVFGETLLSERQNITIMVRLNSSSLPMSVSWNQDSGLFEGDNHNPYEEHMKLEINSEDMFAMICGPRKDRERRATYKARQGRPHRSGGPATRDSRSRGSELRHAARSVGSDRGSGFVPADGLSHSQTCK
ncbi:hypothetical protein FALBO_10020 [Fusarium albosuccineum]|uniref:Uncharacterized protein n=1 Tax=Fusarium albosuccineum TaxID=1237068 RepID=A0A8H4PIQ3_9HYPO|nr:hypothetical protein FALBO_10020 [Fusarium albosuccineum]